MSKTNIEWADYTWNPWSGCNKVSQGCRFCYAEALPPSMRRRAEWGADTSRIEASEEYWRQPIVWDRKAAEEGVRRKVFCASTADIGEARPELDAWRDRALALVALTPNLDWLWLTKRTEYLAEYLAASDLYQRVLDAADFFRSTPGRNGVRRANDRCGIAISDPTRQLPRNLWVGTSVEDQDSTKRIHHLLRIPARVLFLSCEPMLGPVDLPFCECELDKQPGNCIGCGGWGEREAIYPEKGDEGGLCDRCDAKGACPQCGGDRADSRISWVIAGGESGPHARPMHPDWARSLRDQCQNAGVPFFFKQWGEWKPMDQGLPVGVAATAVRNIAPDGSDQDDGRLMWATPNACMHRIGKAAAGRLLDGRVWSEVPQ